MAFTEQIGFMIGKVDALPKINPKTTVYVVPFVCEKTLVSPQGDKKVYSYVFQLVCDTSEAKYIASTKVGQHFRISYWVKDHVVQDQKTGKKTYTTYLVLNEITASAPDYSNEIILLGRIGKEPEFRQFETDSVGNATVACDHGIIAGKNEDGSTKYEDTTTWFNLTAYRGAAKLLRDCHKGDLVFVRGELKIDSWTDKTSHEVRTKHVVVPKIFIPTKSRPKTDLEYSGVLVERPQYNADDSSLDISKDDFSE